MTDRLTKEQIDEDEKLAKSILGKGGGGRLGDMLRKYFGEVRRLQEEKKGAEWYSEKVDRHDIVRETIVTILEMRPDSFKHSKVAYDMGGRAGVKSWEERIRKEFGGVLGDD